MISENLRHRFKKRLDMDTIFDPRTKCRIWVGKGESSGYGCISEGPKNNIKVYRVHRVAYEIAYGSIPINLDICHTCDNRRCINVDHLFAGTRGENNNDRHRKGRSRGPTGSDHASSNFMEFEVIEIRKLHKAGMSYQEIADLKGVSKSCISLICQGRNWKHLNSVEEPICYERAILTEQDVKDIRELNKKGLNYAEIAEKYEITGGNVRLICLRKTWKHVV